MDYENIDGDIQKNRRNSILILVAIVAAVAGVIAFDVWIIKKMGAKYFFMLLALEAVLSAAVMITNKVVYSKTTKTEEQ